MTVLDGENITGKPSHRMLLMPQMQSRNKADALKTVLLNCPPFRQAKKKRPTPLFLTELTMSPSVHSIFQRFARFESNRIACWDFDFSTRLRVFTLTLGT